MKYNINALRTAVFAVCTIAVIVIAIGVLAIPIVMSMLLSCYWLLLYFVYLFAAIYAGKEFIKSYTEKDNDSKKTIKEHKTNANN